MLVSLMFIFLSVYPLNIYELIVKSIIVDTNKDILKKFKLPLVGNFIVFNDDTNVYKSDGIMDINGDIATFNINGVSIELDIVKDLDKIVPMIYKDI